MSQNMHLEIKQLTSPLKSILISDVASPVIINENIKHITVRAIHSHSSGPKGRNNVR